MSSTPLKRRLLNSATEVANINDAGRIAMRDSKKVSLFKGMFRALDRYYQKFEDTWEELVDRAEEESVDEAAALVEDKFPTEADKTLQSNTRRYYFEANSNYEALTAVVPATSRMSLTPGDMNTTQIIHDSRSDLPVIPLPRFDGQLLQWPQFRDTFTAIMSENEHITPQKKFIYLKSALSDQAAAIISSLPIEQQNYDLAWNALVQAFDNKRVLAAAYLNQILDFKPIHGNASIQNLKDFLTKISDSVAAFQLMKIEKESEFILFFLAIRCLDHRTREQFEMSVKGNTEFPTFQQLTEFVRSRVTALQLVGSGTHPNSNSNNQNWSKNRPNKHNKPHTSLLSNDAPEKNQKSNPNNSPVKCVVCQREKHGIAACSIFQDGSVSQRIEWLRNFKGCKNCLAYNHQTDSCKSKYSCKFCKKRHNSYLHIEQESTKLPENSSKGNSTSQGTNTKQSSSLQCCIANKEPEVVLGTAVVEILDSRKKFQQIRLVVDCGSQHSFISQSCLRRLGLTPDKFSRKISGIGQTAAEGATGKVRCTLRPRNKRSVNLTTDAVVIKNITTFLPNSNIPHNLYHSYLQFELADPKFFQSAPIDFLLGAELFGEIWNGQVITVEPDSPKVYPSVFGHIVMGRFSAPDTPSSASTSLFAFSEDDDLHAELQRFWELEEPKAIIRKNPEEEKCEDHFRKTHYRLPSGQYVVHLPFKNDEVPDLSASSYSAVKRLYNLENKLKNNEELHQQYHDFIGEFIDLGHMSLLATAPPKYVIPHHSIVKEDRNQVKLRVVFDGSAVTPNGSLNDHLLPGEKLQKDIRDILLNFRAHAFVFVTDIVKMFRCILIDPADRPYQCIKWRFDRSEAVKTYQINTCVYGLSSSPWLALRVIQQLQVDEGHNFPLAAEVLNRDIYVDDFATGSNTLSSALELQSQLIKILEKGGFALSKWASNSPELLEAVSENASDLPIPLDNHEKPSLKILGIEWDPNADSFSYRINTPSTASTKRRVLSCVAKIFDPLGFVAPTVFLLKAFIQVLWKNGLKWDQVMPTDLQERWDTLMTQLPKLSEVQVPRFVASVTDCQYQIVAFCDASDKGYCATVFIRTIHSDATKVSLLTAKTKLAPLKFVSTPRKELCGAVLLAELYSSLSNLLKFFENNLLEPQFFTDSSTVLSWLNTPPFRLKTFVANRVTLILQHTPLKCWRHIDSELNPSDCGSRGLLPSELLNHHLWWKGPQWLEKPMSQWPTPSFTVPEAVPELKKTPTTALISTQQSYDAFLEWIKRFSSFHELLRVVAILLRGISNFRSQPNVRDGPLMPADIEAAMTCCVKAVQSELLTDKNRKKGIQKVYANLAPFQDDKGVWRVGGRIRHAEVPYNMKHPILLPAHSHFSVILADYYHRCYLHPSPATLQALLQTRFWIVPSLRRLVRQRTLKCIDCRKRNAKPIAPPMGDLPAYRLQTKRAFAHTGVDFAGPFIMRESLRRKAHTSKIYLALFVCMETKALHLEAVSQLTTDAFLASFDRFISRRGIPEEMYSDNGLNFVGASRKLKEFYQWYNALETKLHITRNGTRRGIKWNFNPPHAPHFGGLWEAGVRSVKRQMCAAAGETPLTFEEFATLFAKIEAILNSRPLCPLSSDPEEAEYLSPGHFLVGGPLLAYPEPSHLEQKEHLLTRWQIVKRMYETFWKRWRLQYLNTLQKRVKWTESSPNLAVGDLVLVRGPSQTAYTEVMHWPVARVTATHPGADNVVRVVTIRYGDSVFQRPVVELIPLLPLPDPKTPDSPAS